MLDVVSGDHPEEARVNGTEFSEIEYAAINNPDSGTVIVTPGGTLIGQFFYDFELPDDIDTKKGILTPSRQT